jgi:O-antigen ligase
MNINALVENVLGSESWQKRKPLERAAFIFILIFAFACPVSIAIAQGSMAAATLCWLFSLKDGWRPLEGSRFIIPLALFGFVSLGAVLFSVQPMESLWHYRNVLLFLIVPVVMQVVRNKFDVQAVLSSMALGALVTSFIGFYQMITGTGGGTSHMRLTGNLSHYMTAGGVLMIASLMLLAVVLFSEAKKIRYISGAVALVLLVALAFTQTRNTYLGIAAGLIILLFSWRKGFVFLLPFIISLAILLSPPIVRERMFKIADMQDASVQSRFYMMEAGAGMVADYPLFGVGLNQVEGMYERYRPEAETRIAPHLHNNIFQIAAERGVPALGLWLLFMIVLFRNTHRKVREKRISPWGKILASGALAVVTALFIAGMFEYNFGDSEVRMLFFLCISLPFGYIAEGKEKKAVKRSRI